jgi:hypothetical protein
MKCGLYVRVSTNKQETCNQLTQLREFARAMTWHVVVEYVDQITGKHSERWNSSACLPMRASVSSMYCYFGPWIVSHAKAL